MSGSARNFRSARDRTEERQPPTKIRKQNAYSGIERRSDSRVWSDFEENHSELPSREPLHGNRYMQKDDRRKLERERSPGFDRWGSENKSGSLSDGWDLPERGKAMSQGRSRSRDRRMSQSRSRSRSRGRARSRSRSRGRARDRSRSPFEVHRRVSYGMIDRSGTGTSSQPCKYFAAGMCRKGSQCNFFHPDNLGSRDGKYYENDPEPRRRGRLEYRDEVEFSDNYERGNRNVSADYDLKRQPIRSGKPFCKDFGMGKCHRDNCRFSHDDPAADDKWSNDRRGRNHDERTKTWNGPTWDDYNKTSDSAKFSGWGEKLHDPTVGEKQGDDRRGRNLDEKMKSWNDTKDTLDAAKSTGWGEGSVVNPRFDDHDHDPKAVENRSDDRRRWNSNEKSKVWNGPTWDDAKDTSDAAKSTGWGDNSVGKIKLQDPTAAEHRGDDRQDRNLDEKTKLWYEVKDISDAANSTGWGEGSVMNRKLHDPIEKQTGDRRGPDFDEKTKPANAPTFDDVKGISDTVKAGGWGDGIGEISTFHDPTAADERGPHIIHESSLSQSHEISTRIDEQNVTLEAGALQTSIRVSENSYNIAVTEDFNALNEVKVSDQNGRSMSSLPFPTSTVTDDSGARLISSNGHNIDLNVPFQTMNPETEAETLPKETGKPSSKILDTGAPREVSQNVVNPKAEEQENINGKVEESNNNVSKEEKAMRVFKIALVEFVKEILKPKWKEGQMSREVHKTIVKKTVDKVSSTIPGDQIPNTQEKISQYLSFSKGKISKLVHAYVERFLKT